MERRLFIYSLLRIELKGENFYSITVYFLFT